MTFTTRTNSSNRHVVIVTPKSTSRTDGWEDYSSEFYIKWSKRKTLGDLQAVFSGLRLQGPAGYTFVTYQFLEYEKLRKVGL